MEVTPQDHLSLLRQLALEYQQKFNELEETLRGADPDAAIHQLKVRGELTTDRFRMAQHFLLDALYNQAETAGDETLRAAATLCRCFDEMRILFQVLLEHSTTPAE